MKFPTVEKSADVDGAMAGRRPTVVTDGRDGRSSMAMMAEAGSMGRIGRTSMTAPKNEKSL